MKYVLIVVVVVALCWIGIVQFNRANPHVEVTVSVLAPVVSSRPVVKVTLPAPSLGPSATPPSATPVSSAPSAPTSSNAVPTPTPSWAAVPWPILPSPVNEPGKPTGPPTPLPQIVLSDVLGPNNLYHDDVFGVSATYPDGWTVAGAGRWGTNNSENSVGLAPDTETSAHPSMYYQMYPYGYPELEGPEAYFRRVAQNKESQRVTGGVTDYNNVPSSFEFTTINGNPAVSYFAVFTRGEEVQTEFFIRVLGKKGYVMFTVPGRMEDVQALIPKMKQMASTVKVP